MSARHLVSLLAFASLLLAISLPGCPTNPGGGDDDDATGGDPALLGIGVTPNDPVMAVGESVSFEAKAFYDDYTNEVITHDVDWVTSDDRVAEIGSDGHCSAVGPGVTDVIATYGYEASAKVTLTVSGEGVGVVSVELTPAEVDLHVGDTVQISAVANFDDGSSGNVAGSCTWSVDDGGVASVDGTGGVTAVAVGSTQVRAEYQGLTIDPATINVLDDEITLPEADLRIASFDATVAGDIVTYDLTVENQGDGYASEFNVYVYLDENGVPDPNDPEDGWTWVPGCPAGDTIQVVLDLFDVTPGNYSSYALVDPEDVEPESNENNNSAGPLSVTVEEQGGGEPDLAITEFDGLTDGYYTLYYVEITNIGDGPSDPCDMDIYLDEYYEPSPGQYGDYYVTVPYLDPGDTYIWEPEVDDGPTYFWDSWIQVDTLDDVIESDEYNNTEWITLYP